MSMSLPWKFLEEGRTESAANACRPLTTCNANDNDLAQLFSAKGIN